MIDNDFSYIFSVQCLLFLQLLGFHVRQKIGVIRVGRVSYEANDGLGVGAFFVAW
jgi:hypothetical protein